MSPQVTFPELQSPEEEEEFTCWKCKTPIPPHLAGCWNCGATIDPQLRKLAAKEDEE